MRPVAQLDRSGTNECAHCHQGSILASGQRVHEEHLHGRTQWCFDCHEGMDPRPLGQAAPVTTPAGSCQLCHGSARSFTADFPFAVHNQHARAQKCYSCHQGTPPLFDWPERWQRQPATFANYGSACVGGGNRTPGIGHVGLPRLGQTFAVTLSQGPANTLAALLVGFDSMVLPLDTEGMTGCALLVYPFAAAFYVTTTGGAATHQQPMPSLRELIGVPLYFQWLVADAAANPRGLTTSDGGRATLGR